jgi:gliding motility-associated-like protein
MSKHKSIYPVQSSWHFYVPKRAFSLVKTGLLLLCIVWTSICQAQLSADFTSNIRTGCAPQIVRFTDNTIGSPIAWHWDFGNGLTSSLQNPIVTYFVSSPYSIKLVVTDANGNRDSVIKSNYILVNAAPTVDFTTNDTTGCYPLLTQFTDQSTANQGALNSWLWEFGDGDISYNPNPNHIYNALGNYNVKLTVTNSTGCAATFTKPAFIKINKGVRSSFSFVAPQNCNPPSDVPFTNLSTGTGIIKYIWNFGDGGISVQDDPSHTYTSNGFFTVSLISFNDQGCSDTMEMPNIISVGQVLPRFSLPDSVCAGSYVQFTNTSLPLNSISSQWVFHDGTTSQTINGSKKYDVPGLYPIKLIVQFGSCIDSVTKMLKVVGKPNANFISSNPSACKGPLTVRFTNSSSNAIGYKWDFGDGSTSISTNPTKTYNGTGSFTVKLITQSSNGCYDTLTKINYIRLIGSTITRLDSLPTSGCKNLIVRPRAVINGVENIVRYKWNFGDGGTANIDTPSHLYTALGKYNITVSIITTSGCVDTFSMPNAVSIKTKPVLDFDAVSRAVCASGPIQFVDRATPLDSITSRFWDFGDGLTGSSLPNPIHQYQDTGNYTVKYYAYNEGCGDSIIKPNFVKMKPPIARFHFDRNCNNKLQIQFVNTSIGGLTYFWDFGNGQTSTLANPVVTYDSVRMYVVKLIAYNDTCQYETYRNVTLIKEPKAFAINDTAPCLNAPVQFSTPLINTSNISVYDWDFGDGQTATGNLPITTHRYTQSGSIQVRLIIRNVFNCFDTIYRTINVRTVASPTASFAISDTNCLSRTILFSPSSNAVGGITAYWDFGNGTQTSTTSVQNVSTVYDNVGTYEASFVVGTNQGCISDTFRQLFYVHPNPVTNFDMPGRLCLPNALATFVNRTYVPNNFNYQVRYNWTFGDGHTSSSPHPTNIYVNAGPFNVQLKTFTNVGCYSDTAFIYDSIIPQPIARFFADTVCLGHNTNFIDSSLAPRSTNTNWIWHFGDGQNGTTQHPTHNYLLSGTYQSKLVVRNAFGCVSDTAYRSVKVVNKPTAGLTMNMVPCSRQNIFIIDQSVDNNYPVQLWKYNFNGIWMTQSTGNSSFVFNTPGVQSIKQVVQNAFGCFSDTANLSITILPTPFTNFNLPDSCVVNASSFVNTSTVLASENPLHYAWQFNDPLANIANPNNSNLASPMHTFNATGNYAVSLKLTNQMGCADSITKTFRVLGSVPSTNISIHSNQQFCSGNDVLFTNASSTRLGNINKMKFAWDWPNNPSNVDSFISPTSNQIFNHLYPAFGSPQQNRMTVRITTFSGNGCQQSLDTFFTMKAKPVLSLNSIPPVCSNDSSITLLQGNITNSAIATSIYYGPGVRFDVTRNGYIFNPQSLPYYTQPLITYKATTALGCADSISQTMRINPAPVVNAGMDKTILLGGSAIFDAAIIGNVQTYRWTPNLFVHNNGNLKGMVSPDKSMQYKLTATTVEGCSNSDSVWVTVKEELNIPNAFSPNGDGINDTWNIEYLNTNTNATLLLYDRYGKLVFETKRYNQAWDGTVGGKPLPVGTYYYVVINGVGNKSFKGSVAIIR